MIGWFRARLGGARFGRPIRVVFWGKPDCSLCDQAMAVLDRLGEEYPVTVDKRDITTDPAAYERYRWTIPVVEIEDGPRLEGRITEHQLRQAFQSLQDLKSP